MKKDVRFLLACAIVGTLLAAFSSRGYADDSAPKGEPSRWQSDRLPPVLPGEVVTTENGDQIKVWSSAGPVPVSTAPSAPNVPGSNLGVGGGLGGILVDAREDPGLVATNP